MPLLIDLTEFLVKFAVSLAKSVSSTLAAAAAKFADAEYATACLPLRADIPAATCPKNSHSCQGCIRSSFSCRCSCSSVIPPKVTAVC